MELTTPIKITPLEQTIHYGDGLLFLGSCFANEVGGLCRSLGFNAQVNPFGVLYNPVSIAQSLKRLQSGIPFSHDEVIRVGGEFYCTFSHNTDFWCPSEETLLEKVNAHLVEAHDHFLHTKWVVLSLGTSWAYFNRDSGHRQSPEVVANCHKLPANRFERVFLPTEQTARTLVELLNAFPDKQFIFTVSPLRHLKDGLHENQLSKASLLLAVDEVCRSHEKAHYFPAYEILLDELRDYRFFKEDMIHPTEQAVRYIWERFVDFAIDPSEKPAMKAAEELKKMLHHRPLFPDSLSFKEFEALKQRKIAALKARFPEVLLELMLPAGQ